MVAIDVALSVAASAIAVIASLQAGSRAKYILEKNEIGVKSGPLILPPKGNETSPLWDLVQVFQQSVQLGLLHELDGSTHRFVRQSAYKQMDAVGGHDHNIEPYSLSPFPKSHKEDDEQLDDLVDMYIEETMNPKEEEEESLLSKNIQKFFEGPTRVSQTTKYWMKRAWYWRKSREDFDDEFLEEVDDGEMDLSQCLSKKIRLKNLGGNATQRVAQINAYAPETFARLRSYFKISEASFRRSIFESGPYISFQSNSKGAARSGGVFFFTRDGAYMIKTIKTGEAQTFIKMLPKYYKHMKRNKRHSLLTRFCGMYTVNIRDATSRAGLNSEEQYTFVIMNSVFPAEASDFISQMYDLKGSTVGRACSEEEKKRKGPNAVLKDLDLAREVDVVRSVRQRGRTGYGIQLGASAKSKLLAQLRKDVALLQDVRVMDYSLLVGIVNMDQETIDRADMNTLVLSINEEKRLELARSNENTAEVVVTALTTPFRLLMAPPLFFTRKLWRGLERTLSTVLTYPLPYYGSSTCVIDGGALSRMHGLRSGKRAIYYLGLIDFLQPWTTRKVAEKQLKGLLGYDTKKISCVDPDEYASRFLDFIEAHVT